MNCYTALRKQREEFREKVIRIISAVDETPDVCHANNDTDWLSEDEQELLRYYYYIMHGIDNVHIGPIDVKMMKNIIALVPVKWREHFPEILTQLEKDALDDYMLSVKKSIVDFVLQDPQKSEAMGEEVVSHLGLWKEFFSSHYVPISIYYTSSFRELYQMRITK